MDFKEHLKKYLSDEEIDSLIASFESEEQKGLYLNTNKLSHEDLLKEFPNLIKNPDIDNGYLFFKSENPIGSHLFFDLGAYYIQDPSAMNVANMLPLDKGDLILDMCAAPGGKTNVLSLRLGDNGQVVANDISSSRCQTLLQNVERMGLDNVTVTNLDFSRIYKSYPELFTKIVLDAPCSGSGMFRKSSLMKDDWTYEKVLKYQAEQKKLIDICSYMLKEGGYLIYSTCSYSYEEDEEIIKYALDNFDFELVNLPSISGGLRTKEYPEAIHLFPSNYKGEGQYIALLRKKGNLTHYPLKEVTYTRKSVNKGNKPIVSTYKLNMELPSSLLEKALRPGLFILTSYIDGSNLMYEHHYAKSLKKGDERLIDISLEETKKIIAGESINLDLPDGDYFLSYLGMSICVVRKRNGLVKNHYPKGIRKRY